MAIINQSNILNLQPGITAPVVVHMSEGDVGTKLSFKLIDGVNAWTDPGNVVAAVHGRRQDGTQFGPYACSLLRDTISFQTDAAMAGAAGSGIAEIVLTDSNGNSAGSANFAVMVERSTFPLGVTYRNDVSVYEAILAYAQTTPAQLAEDFTEKLNEEAATRAAADLSIQSEISAEATERAQQDAVLSARMDEFSRLPDGSLSTAADAELVDIRVMIDGQTAATAGDAVRDQAQNLSDGINNVADKFANVAVLEAIVPEYEMLTNKVISAAGIISNASGDLYQVTDYIPVESGQLVTIRTSRARWANRNWAFYDKNKHCIATNEKSSGTTETHQTRVIAPVSAKYVVVGYDINGVSGAPASPDVRIGTKYGEAIDAVPISAVRSVDTAIETEEDYTVTEMMDTFISTYGDVVGIASTASISYRVTQLDVEAGDIINIRNCASRYAGKMYAFFDATGLAIQVRNRIDNNAHDFYMVKVPFGAKSLAVSGINSFATVKKVVSFSGYKNIYSWLGVKWAAMGDSLTDSGNTRASKRYFDYIAENTGIVVTNLGKSGTGYMKPYNSSLPFYQRVDTIPLDSDVITIFGSGNDCSLTLGSPTDTGTDTVCGCINNTIDGIRSRIIGANLGIITPTPWDDYPTTTPGNRMDLYADALVEICRLKGVPCLDLYHCSNMLPWEQAFREAYYTKDDGNGVHPDENGHKLFAPRIQAFLSTLLM